MRGEAERQSNIMLAVTPDSFIPGRPPDPPHQADRRCGAAAALAAPRRDVRHERGRPSIPPEHLLKASLLIALYSIRSER